MKDPTDIGLNRTGIATSPLLSAEMVAGARAVVPRGTPEDWLANPQHSTYIADAEPVGTMPPPANLRGIAKSALKALQGEKASVLLDKLGERLAFERSGSRLYESFLPNWRCSAPRRAGLRWPRSASNTRRRGGTSRW